MSTSAASTSSLISPSELAHFMSEQHYLFLSQSLNDLEHQVKRHRAEQQFISDQLLKAGLVEPQIKPHARTFHQQMTRRHRFHPYNHPVSPSPSRRTPSSLASFEPTLDVEIQPHRHFLKDPPPSRETPDEELGTKGNPIYVLDDDEIECDGYWDGHWDRTNTYRQYNRLWNEDAKCGKSTTLNNPHTG